MLEFSIRSKVMEESILIYGLVLTHSFHRIEGTAEKTRILELGIVMLVFPAPDIYDIHFDKSKDVAGRDNNDGKGSASGSQER